MQKKQKIIGILIGIELTEQLYKILVSIHHHPYSNFDVLGAYGIVDARPLERVSPKPSSLCMPSHFPGWLSCLPFLSLCTSKQPH